MAGLLALPATSSFALAGSDEAGRRSLPGRAAGWLSYALARLSLNGLRSIPELVWVLILVQVVGLGPFAGALAIGLHTGGVLGKLYAESLEEVPGRPVEALRACGAKPLQVLVCAILPQAMPMLLSYSVLRWGMNLRVSTILGMVGGGGLGQEIYNNVQLGFYQRVGTLILITYALVMSTDWIARRLRLRHIPV
jgi:phosphonate transport system permease protein